MSDEANPNKETSTRMGGLCAEDNKEKRLLAAYITGPRLGLLLIFIFLGLDLAWRSLYPKAGGHRMFGFEFKLTRLTCCLKSWYTLKATHRKIIAGVFPLGLSHC